MIYIDIFRYKIIKKQFNFFLVFLNGTKAVLVKPFLNFIQHFTQMFKNLRYKLTFVTTITDRFLIISNRSKVFEITLYKVYL
jgi:hypothetical protein